MRRGAGRRGRRGAWLAAAPLQASARGARPGPRPGGPCRGLALHRQGAAGRHLPLGLVPCAQVRQLFRGRAHARARGLPRHPRGRGGDKRQLRGRQPRRVLDHVPLRGVLPRRLQHLRVPPGFRGPVRRGVEGPRRDHPAATGAADPFRLPRHNALVARARAGQPANGRPGVRPRGEGLPRADADARRRQLRCARAEQLGHPRPALGGPLRRPGPAHAAGAGAGQEEAPRGLHLRGHPGGVAPLHVPLPRHVRGAMPRGGVPQLAARGQR
mmetsp:Transcript_41923/g.129843  ORF Transcript_41923/g.129843 Transcript_41923/m.129843 type:complete len:270 (+) Transcript_41923:251-1060(+)